MQEIAETRGGNCLSTAYVNARSKLTWQCQKRHQWQATPDNIIRKGSWCPICSARQSKVTIEQMHTLAAARGGKCLSKKYTNAHSKLIWQCQQGHQWQATPLNVKQGTWCPTCNPSGSPKGTIQQMHHLAAVRGGKCLSPKYTKNSGHLLWQCQQGHQWQAMPRTITSGRWCPFCPRKTGHRTSAAP